MAYNMKPPKFEIADLHMQESDLMYPDAVRCVQTYWKQASRMTSNQCYKYLWYLQSTHREEFLVKPFATAGGTVTVHSLYQRARDDEGKFCRLSWAVYLVLSTLYGDLPRAYKKAIAERYGTSIVEDRSMVYRHFYPTPASTTANAVIRLATTLVPKDPVAGESTEKPTPACHSLQTVVDVDLTALIRRKEKFTLAGIQNPPALSTPEKSLAPEPWNIDNIVGVLTVPKTKRLSSALESSPKRAKLDRHEILKQVNHQSEIIKQTIHNSQSSQNAKLQLVHSDVEQNTQALSSIQSDLRQFMSAVASTLRDIREHLDE